MKKFPIAEIFTSPQGEGLYQGTLMTFIRFAGCSVGKKMTDQERATWHEKDPEFGKHGELPIYTEKCTLYDGREFLCDTDFRTKQALAVEEIMAQICPDVHHVCLTGGEPLDQPMSELLEALFDRGLMAHIETSGTVDIKERAFPEMEDDDIAWDHESGLLWITVAPKKGVLPIMIERANEVKLLVDSNFDIEKVPGEIKNHPLVYLSAVNHEYTVDSVNMTLCLALQKSYPNFRLALQAHKIWNVR